MTLLYIAIGILKGLFIGYMIFNKRIKIIKLEFENTNLELKLSQKNELKRLEDENIKLNERIKIYDELNNK
ncbi:MAG: hypothetical protein N4A49_08465 [Marinifilaceae bacterium]|jgi:hypothetical protein|nr:hypothetical protein [Marinifilaceae bacterium]